MMEGWWHLALGLWGSERQIQSRVEPLVIRTDVVARPEEGPVRPWPQTQGHVMGTDLPKAEPTEKQRILKRIKRKKLLKPLLYFQS